jgi:hypothetical protein
MGLAQIEGPNSDFDRDSLSSKMYTGLSKSHKLGNPVELVM